MSKKRVKKTEVAIEFPGYGHCKAPGQFFMYPIQVTHYWWALTGAEQKVLDYIIRKTFGWQKQGDKIAICQIVGDGVYESSGTGLSRTAVKTALKSLEKKKFITIKRNYRQPSYIELPLAEGEENLDGWSDLDVSVYKMGLNKGFKKDVISGKGDVW